jgi:hypothetical protein
VRRRWFWPLIGIGSALYAVAAASFAFAFANRNYAEPSVSPGWTNYVPLDSAEGSPGFGVSVDADACFTCVEPLPWLVAGIVLAVVGLIPYIAAVRYR